MNKYFYHLTDKENLKSILTSGLEPRIGENSKRAQEEENQIYLCKRCDLPYWKILLKKNIVLQIKDINEDETRAYPYNLYDEYLYDKNIPAENIKRVYTPAPTEKHMKRLCQSYIESLNRITTTFARYCYDKDGYEIQTDQLEQSMHCLLYCLNNLDYSVCTKKEIRQQLKADGECGEYTFLDTYLDTGHRLYEQLILYEGMELIEERTKLYNYIKTTFKGCLDINTGGWTG